MAYTESETPSKRMMGHILLLPNEATEPPIASTRALLNKSLNAKIPMLMQRVDSLEKKEDKDDSYTEFILHLDCDFSQMKPDWVIDRFTENNLFNGFGESWLSFSHYFNLSKVKAHHRHVTLLDFSFGSLVGFNNYVEHYAASWSKDNQMKQITQLKVRFEHHMQKIRLLFIVADRRYKIRREMDGRSHRLHSLEILYSMIKRILIVKRYKTKDCPQHFELYLQMTAAPTLKKLEQQRLEAKNMNEKFARSGRIDHRTWKHLHDHDDSFRFVSAQFETPDTPYMRDVQFGQEFDWSDDESEDGRENGTFCGKSTNKCNGSNLKGKSKNSGKTQGPIKTERQPNLAHCNSKVIGMCRVIKLELTGEDSFDAIEQLVATCADHAQVFFTSMRTTTTQTETPNVSVGSSSFDCLYALKCILTCSFQISDELWLRKETPQVTKKLQSYCKENPEALAQTLHNLYIQIDNGNVIRFPRALDMVYAKRLSEYDSKFIKENIPSDMVMMKRAVLTPTRFYFIPPIPQMKSFLLRNCDPEYAMRITVRDDNMDQLTFTICGTKENRSKFLIKHLGNKLQKGFTIGNRRYEFFGSSTSQLREHGCFFFAKDNQGRDAEYLRQSVGDVQSIKTVPKFMARLGQSLSQSLASIHIPKEWIVGPVDDVVKKNPAHPGKEFNFTDGIGKMSLGIAEMIYAALHLDPDDKPSAAQIRYAGCKGMLAVDPTLEGNTIVFRKSQWKFDSDQDSLEILKVSRPQKCFLNRPFITILDQMGIPGDVFTELQQLEFSKLIGSLIDGKDAMMVLKNRAALRLPYARLHQCGVDLSTEPFFQPIVLSLYRRSLSELKHKARIMIPFEKSRTMFGVVDETPKRKLKYGQVFFQYSNITVEGKVGRVSTIYTGTVLITKNPCMHPGDVRKFEAVDIEDLHHLKDVLVFPRRGKRPHPDEMAGSDLDGDEYCVIWYEDLIFSRENHEAMDYAVVEKPVQNNKPKPEKKENQEISVPDMAGFMCRYIQDDCVGLIASAHLAWADQIGIFDEMCMIIAKKYSVTLDFAKSGQPEELERRERVQLYPDFMEKSKEKRTYLSINALGELFRNVKRIELVSEVLTDDLTVEIDSDYVYPGWEEYKEDAEQALKEYKYLLFTPLKMLQMSSEGDIMSGAVKKIEKTFMGKNAMENIERTLDCIIPRVFRKMRTDFLKEFLDKKSRTALKPDTSKLNGFIKTNFNEYCRDGFVSANDLMIQMFKKVSAWYQVAYNNKSEISALGLPWTMSELLGLLKADRRLKRDRQPVIPVVEKAQMFIAFILDDVIPENGELPASYSGQPNRGGYDILADGDSMTERQKVKVVLQQWIQHNKDIITLRGVLVSTFSVLTFRRFDEYARQYIKEHPNPAPTAGQLLVAFLRETSQISCTPLNADSQNQNTSMVKDLAILSITALTNLISRGKMWDENVMDNVLFREYRETIRFPIELRRRKHNGDGNWSGLTRTEEAFRELITRYEHEVKATIKAIAKLTSVDIDCIEEKQKDCWYIVMTVFGKMCCIEYLKDFMVQSNFASMLIKLVENGQGIQLESTRANKKNSSH